MSKEMDRAEQQAEEYLQSLGYTPVFEPNGRDTFPDFEVTPALAAEVRILNENHFNGDKVDGLQTGRESIYKQSEEVFRSFDRQFDGHTYFVGINFIRPLPEKSRIIRKALRQTLAQYLENPGSYETYEVLDFLTITLFESEYPIEEKTFYYAGGSDLDSGGFVVSLYIQNLKHCIADKTEKQQRHRDQYAKWWLILVDRIAYGVRHNEINTVLFSIEKPENWDKIILLNRDAKPVLEF